MINFIKTKECWIMKFKEALENDIIESGDVIAWTKDGVNIDHVALAYVPNKDNRWLFQAKKYKGVHKTEMDSEVPFFIIKSNVIWKKKLTDICNYLVGTRYGYVQHFLTRFKMNRPLGGLTNSTFVAMLLNTAGYRLEFVGLTPTILVSELLGLGRKSIEITDDD
jgi:hypothetical protein